MAFSTRAAMRAGLSFGLALCASVINVRGTQDAVANGDTRTLDLYHAHTRESLRITFKSNGFYDRDALQKLNWFLRDWRRDEPTSMSPGLFDIVWYAYRESGASEPIKVVSAYRAPSTNEMLRRRSRAVAKESQHTRGNAMDFHIPGVSMAKVREIAMKLQRGGVGYYPSAGSPFVHLDVGTVRSWPRMTRDQLLRIFPDEKTVHLPADGVPLANYQVALAEVQARGGSALDYDTVTRFSGKSLWALLFGSGDEDSADPSKVQVASARGRGRGRNQPAPQVAALPSNASSENVMLVAAAAPQAFAPAPRGGRVRPEQVVRPAPSAEPVIRTEGTGDAAGPGRVAPLPPPAAATPPPAPPAASAVAVAALPLPPVRPRGLPEAVEVAIALPLPPVRPSGLASAAPAIAAADPAGDADRTARNAEPAPVLVAGLPLPPVRDLPSPVADSISVAPAAPAETAEARAKAAEPAPTLAANLPVPPRRAASLPSIVTAAARPDAITTGSVVQAYAPQPARPTIEARPAADPSARVEPKPPAQAAIAAPPRREAKWRAFAASLEPAADSPAPQIYGSFAGGFIRKLAPGHFSSGW